MSGGIYLVQSDGNLIEMNEQHYATEYPLQKLLADHPDLLAGVGRELQLDKNATYQRVQRALEGGYLKNLEERQGRPYQLVLGDPMPEDRPILPDPWRLQGFTVSGVSEG